jgi:exopolysaccharide biosynthesis polyprenyl glycosylphosphotransferase
VQDATRVGTGPSGDNVIDAEPEEINLIGQRNAFVATGVLTAPAKQLAHRAGQRHRWVFATAALTMVIDVVAIGLGYFLAKVFRDGDLDIGPALLRQVDTAIFATAFVWPVIFAIYGLYDLRRPTHITAEMQRLFQAVVTSVLVVALIAFAVRIDVSRSFIVSLLIFCLATTAIGRLAVRRLSHVLNARGVTSQSTLIAGCNEEARTLARTLRRRPWMGFEVCGFVDVGHTGQDTIDGLPVMGSIDGIQAIVREHGIGSIVVAGSAVGAGTLQQLDTALVDTQVTVRVSPGLPNLGASRVIVEPVDGMALFSLRRQRFSRRQRVLKRALDVTIASGLLVVSLPAMAVVALLVKVTSPGPVLFRQRRVGAGGRTFTIYKFRTMVDGAERQLSALQAHNEADGILFKMRRDPRVTPVGRLLRRCAADELPQLINVLMGEMSMVGPRPALPEETARYDERWRDRLRVKPGLTGLWQVNGRHDLGFDDYVRYDLFYVTNWSLTLDLYILAKTVPALLTTRGSY